ncbi:hypothetical protein KKF59_02945 [Patescibacteria group bacterium]|nr:hypothetical protein [Patescibacteria group bacterium]MBU1035050.1 hypothetical protein [Patescibacteria group bacterium]MBU1908064.1 hypothetical protein [Patescibacteria group bacterium]
MKRKTRESAKIISCSLLKILAMGTLVTIAGLLSQGKTADKLVKDLGRYSAWEIKQLLRRLKVRKLITYDEEDEHSPIMLTERGFSRLSKDNFKVIKGRKWDHFWRLILFDIPEYPKKRQSFQRMLCSLGCFQVQKSVYAYPFDCQSDLIRLASQYKVGGYVTVLTIPTLGPHEKNARDFYFKKSR